MKKVLIVMLNPSIDSMIEFNEFNAYKTNRAVGEHDCMGGKGLNVAYVVRSFGIDTTLTGFIGADKANELSLLLDKADIKNESITVSGKTRTNLKLLDKSNMRVTEVNGISFSISDKEKNALTDKLNSLMPDYDIIVVTGSMPQGIESGFYAEIIKKANSLGKTAVLDASGAAFSAAVAEKPYAIKPNIDELGELVGEKLSGNQNIAQKARELAKSGISLIAVSMGADGAIFTNKDESLFAENFDIEVKSAVGAGDSVVAAMVYAISENASLEETAKLGAAAGNMTTAKTGTNLCTADEVFASKEKVNTYPIS